jgi:hypothetical protein
MNLDSIDGLPLPLPLPLSEGERVPSGRVRGFRGSRRERSPWGILSLREMARVRGNRAPD